MEFSMRNFVFYDFANKETGSIFSLQYKIDDNPLAHKWFSLLTKSIDRKYTVYDEGEFYGARIKIFLLSFFIFLSGSISSLEK